MEEKLTANNAKRLSDEAINSEVVKKNRSRIYKQIRDACNHGMYCTKTDEIYYTVIEELLRDGYQIEETEEYDYPFFGTHNIHHMFVISWG